ncbi:hypothetical protein GCM10011579_038020 [Streptomyces albiflavescens]|uniref:Uncharacterized protein n=1 Tax=Streptomyces albiflavescens TaxID=1623582 RepID=A0A918D4Y9_9ACTN|nr:hypothetical protein GCM10011579_038020 [Streptomyces albiflavescens]
MGSAAGCSRGVGESLGCAPGRGFAVRSSRAVETNDRVHVDGGALLVFGDAGEGQPRVVWEAGLTRPAEEAS